MGANQGNVQGPRGLPLFQPPYGRITAIDMHTGDVVWMQAHGDGPVNNPALKDVDLPAYLKSKGLERLGNASRAHPLVTKTLLITSEAMGGRGSSAGGGPAANLRAWDKATGELVAELAIPEAFSGTPMTYEVNGKQYITIAAGGLRAPSKLVTLSLP
jgi:quinoprotein glucose dehydrogenase